jgi:hypothetical protein
VDLQFDFPWFGRAVRRVFVNPNGALNMDSAVPCCSSPTQCLFM